MRKDVIMPIMLVMLVFLSAFVLADDLKVKDVDVFFDGKDIMNFQDKSDKIIVNAGDSITFVLTLENAFSRKSDIKIRDIEVEGTIYDIKGRDDIRKELGDFSIEAGRDEEKKLSFTIPTNTLSGVYLGKIEAKGRDEEGATQEASLAFSITVMGDGVAVDGTVQKHEPSTIISTEDVVASPPTISKPGFWDRLAMNKKVAVTTIVLAIIIIILLIILIALLGKKR